MKLSLLAAMVVATASAVFAQSDYSAVRVGPAADSLRRATQQLAQRTSQDLLRGGAHSRNDVQEALLAQQVDASAGLFVEMIKTRRPGIEVREAIAQLAELTRRPSSGSQSGLWRQVQNAVSDVSRELGWQEPGGGRNPRPIVGRATWRGEVDDRVYLQIRGRSIETQTISGVAKPDGVSTFTTPLPTTQVEVEVEKQSGRGEVRVLQQPSRANEFTAVIEIYDNRPGSQEYRLEIIWR